MNEFIYSNNKKQLHSTVHIMDYKIIILNEIIHNRYNDYISTSKGGVDTVLLICRNVELMPASTK